MAGETRASDGMSRGFFVGRRQEMAALAGRGRLVMLAGESGIGKTRTAREFATVAEQHGARILWGRCYEYPGAPPFWPWVEVIRSYVREQAAERLLTEMGAGAADIAEIVPDVRQRQ
jgi:predicted ATPase